MPIPELAVGIIGDYRAHFPSHPATNDALRHAAAALGFSVRLDWIPTRMIAERGPTTLLAPYDALFASPGSPYESMEGVLRGIEYARRRDWPFTGT
jgi:CTP synthase (UTP-ammonia lyase)